MIADDPGLTTPGSSAIKERAGAAAACGGGALR